MLEVWDISRFRASMAATRGRLCFWTLGIFMSLARTENPSSNSGPTDDWETLLSLASASQV